MYLPHSVIGLPDTLLFQTIQDPTLSSCSSSLVYSFPSSSCIVTGSSPLLSGTSRNNKTLYKTDLEKYVEYFFSYLFFVKYFSLFVNGIVSVGSLCKQGKDVPQS